MALTILSQYFLDLLAYYSMTAQGETVVDLGSGGGFDCFLASQKVGPTGKVIGIDMTEV